MEKETIKRAYQEAQDSLKEKQVEEVKRIVLKTLEKIETLKGEKEKVSERTKEIDEQIKILRMDIDDLKEGRLDRIEERQEKDPQAKNISVVIIIKEKTVEHDYPHWYWPYRFEWVYPYWNPSWTDTTGTVGYAGEVGWVNCSSAKWGASGAYQLSDGNTVNLR